MNLDIKLTHPDAKMPQYSTSGAAAFDLYATEVTVDLTNNTYTYGTGLAMAIPNGHFALLMPRSSVVKQGLYLANGIGLIDSDYRGELKAVFAARSNAEVKPYKVGDRVAQLLVLPKPDIHLRQVENLPVTLRGNGGFGSTGL